MHESVAILGVGAIGELLAAGLARAGWEPETLILAARRPERPQEGGAGTGPRAPV